MLRGLKKCLFMRTADGDRHDRVTMRVPIDPDRAEREQLSQGEQAAQEIARFHLASAAGILKSGGFEGLAVEVLRAAEVLTTPTMIIGGGLPS
jgi:hypothetical protein